MRLPFARSLTLATAIALISTPAFADRSFTDQMGREVVVADKIERSVVLFHQALDVVAQLDATAQVAGVLVDWDKRLSPGFRKITPEFIDIAKPGELRAVNMESLLELDPDLVIIPHFMDAAVIKQLEDANIPTIALAFADLPESQYGKTDPELEDEKAAYTAGVTGAVELLGEIYGKEDQAEKLVAAMAKGRAIADERTAGIPEEDRTRVYLASSETSTRGAGKYTGLIIQQAGGFNVAGELHGNATVTLEQVLAWNPEVIIVEERSVEAYEAITTKAEWAEIDAVKNGKVYLLPEFVRPNGHPAPESLGLGEAYLGSLFYPELYADLDLEAMVQDYYQTFYRIGYARD